MQKKNWLVLGLILGVILIGGGIFLIFNPFNNNSSLLNPLGSSKEEANLKTWEDPVGFQFSYSEGITIDTHEEDEENYAHLELTEKNHPGKILIWMKDKVEKSLEIWVANQAGNPQVFDSELAGQPAKKLAFSSPQKLMTAAFDQEVIILVEVFPEDEWWDETYQQVIDSFELIPLAGEDKSKVNAPGAWQGSGGEAGIIDEGEEIVE
ncbi:hypothetical protein MUP35_02895 [Patescibacteria group bacterium]|nr:hypothetical protein [Patescibacteria group bacterium]